MKLAVTVKEVVRLPSATPTGYGLGKSGWVSVAFGAAATVPVDTVMHWMLASYRAQAPKRLLKALEAEQPWTRFGALPDQPVVSVS